MKVKTCIKSALCAIVFVAAGVLLASCAEAAADGYVGIRADGYRFEVPKEWSKERGPNGEDIYYLGGRPTATHYPFFIVEEFYSDEKCGTQEKQVDYLQKWFADDETFSYPNVATRSLGRHAYVESDMAGALKGQPYVGKQACFFTSDGVFVHMVFLAPGTSLEQYQKEVRHTLGSVGLTR